MSAMRKSVLAVQYLPWFLRLFSVISLFALEEALIISLRNWGISSLLLLTGILACWLFPWRISLILHWCLLWLHLGLLMVFSPMAWGYLVTVLVSGTFADAVLVGSFGVLRTAMDALRANQELQSQFIANLNHEIRNPLAGAIGALDLVLSSPKDLTPSEETMFLSQAKFSCDEILRMTQNIKDAIDPSDDVITPRIIACRLDCVAAELMRYIYTFDHPLEGIDLRDNICVDADPIQVQRVLRNLLHNACKYSPIGTPVSVATGVCRGVEGFAFVGVRDHGAGIPLGSANQLFQKFSRLGEHRIDGTGLGLYNCRRMIEGMGGQIWVESSGVDGEGSTFYFTLPLANKQENLSAITKPYPIIDIL